MPSTRALSLLVFGVDVFERSRGGVFICAFVVRAFSSLVRVIERNYVYTFELHALRYYVGWFEPSGLIMLVSCQRAYDPLGSMHHGSSHQANDVYFLPLVI